MKPLYRADSLFLDPPHSHNPSNVSQVAALPSSMLMQLPESVQDALWALQESTSVVYASYLRLKSLLDERFDRLTPLPGMPGEYSETAFFNYTNAITAERTYLLRDAHPDWKHKARLASLTNPLYSSIPLTYRGRQTTVGEWFSQLQEAETFWIESAREAEVPEFEATVAEYLQFSEMESLSGGETATPSERSFSDDSLEGWNASRGTPLPTLDATKVPDAVKPTVIAGDGGEALHELRPDHVQNTLEAL